MEEKSRNWAIHKLIELLSNLADFINQMQIPIKWNDYMPGIRSLSIVSRRKLSMISNWLSLQVSILIAEKSQALGEGGNMFLCLIPAPDLIAVA